MSESDYLSLPEGDFRRERQLLAPHVFALPGDEEDFPPRDLVPEKEWRAVVVLPTDVAIRTSSHQGSTFATLSRLHSGWIFSWPEPGQSPAMEESSLLAGEEFDAMVFNAVHGYYRQAIGCLRNALEVMAVAASLAVHPNPDLYEKWRQGQEISFGQACSWLSTSERGIALEALATASGARIFGSNAQDGDAWFRALYKRLCGYSHSRAGYNNADFWESNGPIHVPRALTTVEHEFRETLAACYLLLKIGWPALGATEGAELLISSPSPRMELYATILAGALADGSDESVIKAPGA